MNKKSVSNLNNINTETLNKSVAKATKWSSITELAAKLVAPISTIILARVLTPDAFGVMVTATMVISFAEIFTDAGFQKYLIQNEFEDNKDLYESTNVAFITNIVVSIFLWIIICIFSNQIAEVVGSKGYGFVIVISSLSLPITAFSSIQMAIYKRYFDFKTLFTARMVGVVVPLVVTIPMALILRSYWALICGMLATKLSNAIILTWKSEWKPRMWYNVNLFKKMFSFTFWTMLEAILTWLTMYIDIFFIGKMLNEYYLGLYRTSMNTVGQFIGIITVATTPVLFSSLSRLQRDHEGFKGMFFKFQKLVGLLVIPMGTGIFLFRDFITEVLLGQQWVEASYFIGLWALTSAVTIVLSHYSSECYRAKGKPKLSVISQILHLIVLVPVIIWAINYGYNFLCQARAFVRGEAILIDLILMYFFVNISPLKMLENIFPSILGATAMAILYNSLSTETILENIFMIIGCSVVYVGIVSIFPKERNIIIHLKSIMKR